MVHVMCLHIVHVHVGGMHLWSGQPHVFTCHVKLSSHAHAHTSLLSYLSCAPHTCSTFTLCLICMHACRNDATCSNLYISSCFLLIGTLMFVFLKHVRMLSWPIDGQPHPLYPLCFYATSSILAATDVGIAVCS